MSYYYAGCDGQIVERLRRDGRDFKGGVCVQFQTRATIAGENDWHPEPIAEYFPICPDVGDTFPMDGMLDVGADTVERAHKWWRVVSRTIFPSAPDSTTMCGVVMLLVEEVEGPFPKKD